MSVIFLCFLLYFILMQEEAKEEEERIIRQIIEENMDIRGGYSKPKVTDVLWVQLAFLPWKLWCYLVWLSRWWWRFSWKGEEYGDEEKFYLIKKYMGMNELHWEVSIFQSKGRTKIS